MIAIDIMCQMATHHHPSKCRPTFISYSSYIYFKNFCHHNKLFIGDILTALFQYYITNSKNLNVKKYEKDVKKKRMSLVDKKIYEEFVHVCRLNKQQVDTVIEFLLKEFRDNPLIIDTLVVFKEKEKKETTFKIAAAHKKYL